VSSKFLNVFRKLNIFKQIPLCCRENIPIDQPSTSGIEGTSREPQPSTSGTSRNGPQAKQSALELQMANYFLKQKVEAYQESKQHFSYEDIQNNDELIALYTGLPSAKIFLALFNLLSNLRINCYLGWKAEKLDKKDQLLMCPIN
jgi:hypothetical protein